MKVSIVIDLKPALFVLETQLSYFRQYGLTVARLARLAIEQRNGIHESRGIPYTLIRTIQNHRPELVDTFSEFHRIAHKVTDIGMELDRFIQPQVRRAGAFYGPRLEIQKELPQALLLQFPQSLILRP